eukprot:RCo006262
MQAIIPVIRTPSASPVPEPIKKLLQSHLAGIGCSQRLPGPGATGMPMSFPPVGHPPLSGAAGPTLQPSRWCGGSAVKHHGSGEVPWGFRQKFSGRVAKGLPGGAATA